MVEISYFGRVCIVKFLCHPMHLGYLVFFVAHTWQTITSEQHAYTAQIKEEPEEESPGSLIVAVESVCSESMTQTSHSKHPFSGFSIYCRDDPNRSSSDEAPAEDVAQAASASSAPAKFSCRVCARPFSAKTNMYRHLRMMHPGKQLVARAGQYICMVSGCIKRYSYKTDMSRHMRIVHPEVLLPMKTGPYKCNVAGCEKGYRLKFKLFNHLRSEHKIQVPTQYECRLCRSVFATKSDMYRHKASVHGRVSRCDVCSKVCKNRSTLTVHRRMHPEPVPSEDGNDVEQPYKCREVGCKKAYGYRAGLQQHMRKKNHHPKKTSSTSQSIGPATSPEEMYVCRLCGEVCPSVTTMMMHINVSHTQ